MDHETCYSTDAQNVAWLGREPSGNLLPIGDAINES